MSHVVKKLKTVLAQKVTSFFLMISGNSPEPMWEFTVHHSSNNTEDKDYKIFTKVQSVKKTLIFPW